MSAGAWLQVKRAQAHLLEHLYGAMTGLGGAEAEYLLEEDPESVMGREKLKKVRLICSYPAYMPACMHRFGGVYLLLSALQSVGSVMLRDQFALV